MIDDRLAKQPSIRDVWTEDELSRLFEHVRNKANIGRQVVLFLDALDEFHGYPETIACFLGQFNTMPDDISPFDIKICFSSRPWDTFVESFDKCDGFKLQEWTEPDIALYTSAQLERMIQSEPAMRRFTSPRYLKGEMVDYIRNHAEGVFLWVKMVLNDIEKLSHESPELLYQQLTSLPTELEAYYHDIIHRVPPKDRIEAFILLELVRLNIDDEFKDTTAETLFLAARCAWGSTLEECQRLWDAADVDMLSKGRVDIRLRDLCGGMLEVLGSEEHPYIQFMHQTARDFVDCPNFRQLILPRNTPDPHRFDGHVMWTKYEFLPPNMSRKPRSFWSLGWASTATLQSKELENILQLFWTAYPKVSSLARTKNCSCRAYTFRVFRSPCLQDLSSTCCTALRWPAKMDCRSC